jgi:hypothetical protein
MSSLPQVFCYSNKKQINTDLPFKFPRMKNREMQRHFETEDQEAAF